MRTFTRSLIIAIGGFCISAESAPVQIDTTDPQTGMTQIYSATFDGPMAACGPGSPVYCSFFNGEPPPSPPAIRAITFTPNPSKVVNGVPDGIGPGLPPVSPPQPVPAAGSFLDLTRAPGNTSVTLNGGTIKFPDLPIVIRNETVINATGAGIAFNTANLTAPLAAQLTVPLDANGIAEFRVNQAPGIAVDFSAFTVVATDCSGSLCSLIQILSLDMIKYRLVIDYDDTFTTFTASFIGQTANNSFLFATLNSTEPAASAVALTLLADNTRSSSGTLSFQAFKTCAPASGNGCYNPDNNWNINNGVTGSDATWDWNSVTGTLTATGTFWTTSFLSSNPSATSVISDKTVNLAINTVAQATSATAYNCIEGNFLAGVGANGCLNLGTGTDFVTSSTALYNVGGDANCVQRTILGDDVETGNPRGLFTADAVGVCDAVAGAYELYTIVEDNTATGGNLVISNGIPLGNCLSYGCSPESASAGAHWLTFGVAAATANDDGPIDVQQGVAKSIDVLANDTGFNDPVTVTVSTPPTRGTATVIGTSPGAQAGINIEYTANVGATGTDTFVYTVQDAGNTDTAIVTVNILPNAATGSLVLLADNMRSTSGTLSFQAFKTCAPAVGNGCYNPNNAWVIANGVTGSDATWDWDGTTLTATGTFWTTSFLSSSPNGSSIVSDKTVNLSINPGTTTTTATSYQCVEGNFLAGVGANGCLNTTLGNDFINQSSAIYNVGGDANCVQRTVGGDDASTGTPRALYTAPAGGICDAVHASYDLYTVVEDNTATGGNLILSNGIFLGNCLTYGCSPEPAAAGAHWLTFGVASTADTTPDTFAFFDATTVALNAVITSNAITITGINAPTAVSVVGGEYAINGGAFTDVAGTVSDGDTLRLRHTSSAAPDTAVDTVLDVGGVTDTFTSTTLRYAFDDTATTAVNQSVQIDVLQNDYGLLPTVYVDIWTNPLHGSAVASGSPGSPSGIRITYTPAPGYSGPDSFEYWLESGLVVDYAVVSVDVINEDDDGDGVPNSLDNCTLVSNPTQCDSDGDGYGNRCDGDLTNNGFTNSQDYLVFRSKVGGVSAAPVYNVADLNCNGFVNAQDYVLFRQLLGQPSGPSGLVP